MGMLQRLNELKYMRLSVYSRCSINISCLWMTYVSASQTFCIKAYNENDDISPVQGIKMEGINISQHTSLPCALVKRAND